MTYQVDVSRNGKLLLPLDVARALGFEQGDRLAVSADGTTISVTKYVDVVREGQERFRAMLKHPFTVDEFIAEKRVEAARE